MAQTQRRSSADPSRASADAAEGKMGFLEHLDELRSRIIRSLAALAAGMIVSFAFIDRIADFVLAPTFRLLPAGTSLIMTRPGEGLSFYLDLALLGGVLLAAPFITYQVWRFVAPGLYAREKRLIVPFLAVATCGTLAGALFSHYVLFPSMMVFFRTFDSPRMHFMPRVEDTFELYKNTLIGMVAVFQIPTLVLFLARLRLVTPRFLWRHLRYAILISFIAAAVLTPSPDPWNQTVFAAPMIALYLISIGLAWLAAPKPRGGGQSEIGSRRLELVFAATVLDHATRRRRSDPEFPRLWRRT
jgi:sec-independent protein translocase protein TatC